MLLRLPLRNPHSLQIYRAMPHTRMHASATPQLPLSPGDRPPPPTTRYSWRAIHPHATLHYIRDIHQANTHVASLRGPVGFDLEWKPVFTKATRQNPVALVQLANQDTILLIQVSCMTSFPTKLKEFLESPNIVKAGCGIQNDVFKLYNDHRVSTRNCVDLSLLARSADNPRWNGKYTQPLGLARLVAVYEDLLLPKGRITRTNWEAPLSSEQQEYAGNDAHAGYLLYIKLMALARSATIIPKSVYYTFDAVRGRFCEPSGMHWSAFNPNYDPGPPPPPKVSNPPDVANVQPSTTSVAIPSSTSPILSTPRDSPHSHRRPGTQQRFSQHGPRSSSHQDPLSSTPSSRHPYVRPSHFSSELRLDLLSSNYGSESLSSSAFHPIATQTPHSRPSCEHEPSQPGSSSTMARLQRPHHRRGRASAEAEQL